MTGLLDNCVTWAIGAGEPSGTREEGRGKVGSVDQLVVIPKLTPLRREEPVTTLKMVIDERLHRSSEALGAVMATLRAIVPAEGAGYLAASILEKKAQRS